MTGQEKVADFIVVGRDEVFDSVRENPRIATVISVGEPTPQGVEIPSFFVAAPEDDAQIDTVRKAFDMANAVWDQGKTVLFHCTYGERRSPLLATFAVANYYGPSRVDDAVEHACEVGRRQDPVRNQVKSAIFSANRSSLTGSLIRALSDDDVAARLTSRLFDDPTTAFQLLETRHAVHAKGRSHLVVEAIHPQSGLPATPELLAMRKRYEALLDGWTQSADEESRSNAMRAQKTYRLRLAMAAEP